MLNNSTILYKIPANFIGNIPVLTQTKECISCGHVPKDLSDPVKDWHGIRATSRMRVSILDFCRAHWKPCRRNLTEHLHV